MTAHAYTGDIPGVDYTRIEYNTILEQEVKFNIGGHEFTGKLSNGNRLDEEEVDIIILDFMQSYNITTGELQRLEALEDTALKFDESRYVQPRILLEYALVLSGVKNAEQLSKYLTGEEKIDPSKFKLPSTSDMIKKFASMGLDQLKDFALGKLVGEKGKEIIELVSNTTDIALREYTEYLKSDTKAQQGLAAAMALEKFYSLCNARIKAKERELGEAQWRLTCLGEAETEVTLFKSITVPQYWRLGVDLKQTTPDPVDPNGWGGVYTGVVQLNIHHDMTNFDKQFLNKFFLGPGLPFSKMSGVYSFSDQYSAPSTLKRQLRNGNFSIQLGFADIKSGQVEKEFSFAGFEDLAYVWSAHPIRGALEYGPYADGHWHLSGGGVTVHANIEIKHSFLGEPTANNDGMMIDMYSYATTATADVTGPFFSDHADHSDSGMVSHTIATDNSIYDALKGSHKLTISGVD